MKLKKWFSICGELFTYEDKIESSAGDVLIKLNKDSLEKKKTTIFEECQKCLMLRL